MVVGAIQIHATKVVFDWEIWIMQSNAKSEKGFHLGEIRRHGGFHCLVKSKSGFHGFPFYRSIGKSEKSCSAKLFS